MVLPGAGTVGLRLCALLITASKSKALPHTHHARLIVTVVSSKTHVSVLEQ